MKYLFASDLHGSAYYTKKLLEVFDASGAAKLILLGDLLYHGPRNDLPRDYDTKAVTKLLNEYKQYIYTVRGNCDSEVDQMVLEFPCLADYAVLELNGHRFFLSHGHHESPENLPPMLPGEAFVFGHIHLPVAEKCGENYILNPGSVSLPKDGNPNSYALLDGDTFTILDLEGHVLKEITLE